jgi:hypothetical protein
MPMGTIAFIAIGVEDMRSASAPLHARMASRTGPNLGRFLPAQSSQLPLASTMIFCLH